MGGRQCRLRKNACAGAAGDAAAARRHQPSKDSLHHLHQSRRRQYGESHLRGVAPLDRARQRRARSRDPRNLGPAPGPRPPRAGAAAVCDGAGNTGRSQSADHPRLLHAAAAAVSLRGERGRPLQCAGRGRGGAAPQRDQPQRAARCVNGAGAPSRPRARDRDHGRHRSDLQGGTRRSDSQTRPASRLDRSRRQHRSRDRAALRCARHRRRRHSGAGGERDHRGAAAACVRMAGRRGGLQGELDPRSGAVRAPHRRRRRDRQRTAYSSTANASRAPILSPSPSPASTRRSPGAWRRNKRD